LFLKVVVALDAVEEEDAQSGDLAAVGIDEPVAVG
jgi:hypothetical protein